MHKCGDKLLNTNTVSPFFFSLRVLLSLSLSSRQRTIYFRRWRNKPTSWSTLSHSWSILYVTFTSDDHDVSTECNGSERVRLLSSDLMIQHWILFLLYSSRVSHTHLRQQSSANAHSHVKEQQKICKTLCDRILSYLRSMRHLEAALLHVLLTSREENSVCIREE